MRLRLENFLFVLCLAAVACTSNLENPTLQLSADALLDDLHASGDFSGAVMIGRGGEVAYEGAFGMADRASPFALVTAADGGSLAKTVTATLIWRLVDDGSIALDDPVQEYIAEFPYSTVTIRQLLSHTAGLPDYDAFQPLLDSGGPVSNLALQDYMRRISPGPQHEPGTAFSYCNICYDTLALLLERETGVGYRDLAEGMLGDLGAHGAFLRPVRFSDWPQERTLGFRSSMHGAEVFDVFDEEAFYGGSNIYFTVRDLHAWANAWVEGRAVPARVHEEALAPARIGDDASALSLSSWYCAPARDPCYFTGHHQGFFNLVYWDSKREITVVFVSNSTIAPPLQPWLIRTLIAIAERRAFEPAPDLPPEELEVDVRSVAGHYRIQDVGDVLVSESESGPVMQVDQGPQFQLYKVGYGVLYSPGVDAYLAFDPREDDTKPSLIWTSVFNRAASVQNDD